jgi:simple sugar transport system permease protein
LKNSDFIGASFSLSYGIPDLVLLWKTKLGFEIRNNWFDPDAAKYAGIDVARTIVITMGTFRCFSGLAGAIEVTALNHRHELGFSSGYGFDAIAIALLERTTNRSCSGSIAIWGHA